MEQVSGFQRHISLTPEQLLTGDEIIAIVDDDPTIREPLQIYFQEHSLPVVVMGSAGELFKILATRNVALVLLDIGLPDTDGVSLLPQLVTSYPDVAIVMLTGVADLHIALECIRKGADDYLSKPAQLHEILFVVKKTLEKRRLIFENRKYQEDLEKAHFRIHLLHQLSIKMNTAYLSTVELDEVLQAILVGITANEGLRFNRAFLALFDEDGKVLEGRMAIGPDCRDEAQHVWGEMAQRELSFLQIIQNLRENCQSEDSEVNKIAGLLRAHVSNTENILIKSAIERRSIKVNSENGCLPVPLERRSVEGSERFPQPAGNDRRKKKKGEDLKLPVPFELIEVLGEENFVVVPLFSSSKAFGVIIADNFVTGRPITNNHVSALELFASQGSLAIEHSHHYIEMQKKIAQLEALNIELDKNKDLLVEAERYAALGHMAAQLVHTLRNPITSIGGITRILAKKSADVEWQKYLKVMVTETERLESTLEDLFDFVTKTDIHLERVPVNSIVEKTVLLLHNKIVKQHVEFKFEPADPDLLVNVDRHGMQQVILHLTRNALEAMPEGGTLTVSIQLVDDLVNITIMDTGFGINEEYLQKAGDPFFTTKTYGTGMGLTMVGRIVEAHQGTFKLTRRQDGGIKALVCLPLN